jgi:two-component system phosphate regulon response regulator PhoB
MFPAWRKVGTEAPKPSRSLRRSGMRALIVDDEQDISQLLELSLQGAGFETACAADGETALRMARDNPPELILLDLMLPRLPGTHVCRELKRDPLTRHIPIIIVTARATETDRVVAFELGADDYLTKPFFVRELILRCQALVRGAQPLNPAPVPARLVRGPIELAPELNRCAVSGVAVELKPVELRLLAALVRNGGRIVSREELLEAFRGPDYTRDKHTLHAAMRRLAKKLGSAGELIELVRGLGYRLI